MNVLTNPGSGISGYGLFPTAMSLGAPCAPGFGTDGFAARGFMGVGGFSPMGAFLPFLMAMASMQCCPFGGGGFGMGQGFACPGGFGGGAAIQQLLQDPKSLGPGAGMPMLPPDAPPEACRQVLEQRFGMPFERIREQFVHGKQDLLYANRKGQDQRVGEIDAKELYTQIMVESEFGKIGFSAGDKSVGGTGKMLGWGTEADRAKHGTDLGRNVSTAKALESYKHLYEARNGARFAGGMGAFAFAGMFMGPFGGGFAMGFGAFEAICGCSGSSDSYAKAKAAYEAAVATGTPILLDLAGDGVPPVEDGEWKPHPHRFTAKNKRLFDLDADGVKELVEWVNPGGALLCRPDARRDVPDGRHLFGDAGGHQDGYAKLALFDRDGKGYVDLADMEAGGIAVWIDQNGDALVDDGEIRTPRELGISRISTRHQEFRSTFIQDGEEKATWDWWPTYRKVAVGARA